MPHSLSHKFEFPKCKVCERCFVRGYQERSDDTAYCHLHPPAITSDMDIVDMDPAVIESDWITDVKVVESKSRNQGRIYMHIYLKQPRDTRNLILLVKVTPAVQRQLYVITKKLDKISTAAKKTMKRIKEGDEIQLCSLAIMCVSKGFKDCRFK